VTALTTTATFFVDWPDRDVERLSWKIDGNAVFVTLGGTEIQQLVAKGAGGLRDMVVDVTAEQKDRSLGIEGRLTLATDKRELLLRRFALTTANIEWSLPQGQTAVIKYLGDRVDVGDLTLVRGAQQIAVAGGFDLGTDPSPATDGKPLELRLLEVELADVNHALLGTRQLTGRINGTVTITGNRAVPGRRGRHHHREWHGADRAVSVRSGARPIQGRRGDHRRAARSGARLQPQGDGHRSRSPRTRQPDRRWTCT
jgi:hypothetical protein